MDIDILESDLGEWFKIDGKAIANQPQLDLAIINLAEFYGYFAAPCTEMEKIHKLVYETDADDLPRELVHALIWRSEEAHKFLNGNLPDGFKFTFEGDEFDTLCLRKL